ncbi:hypothetical protein ASD48_04055 [Streptomyces sp. Root1310]|nr:hypothetical protein ASD48_04055 [Streptomyces sp. Root1310]
MKMLKHEGDQVRLITHGLFVHGGIVDAGGGEALPAAPVPGFGFGAAASCCRGLGQFTLTAAQAAATALYSVVPVP